MEVNSVHAIVTTNADCIVAGLASCSFTQRNCHLSPGPYERLSLRHGRLCRHNRGRYRLELQSKPRRRFGPHHDWSTNRVQCHNPPVGKAANRRVPSLRHRRILETSMAHAIASGPLGCRDETADERRRHRGSGQWALSPPSCPTWSLARGTASHPWMQGSVRDCFQDTNLARKTSVARCRLWRPWGLP